MTREEEERYKKLEDETWDEGLPLGINSDVEFEDPEVDAVGLGMVMPIIPALQTPVTIQQLYEFTGSAVVPPTPNVSQVVSLFAGLEEERKKQKLGAAGAIPPALPPLTITLKPAIKFKPVDAEGDVHIGQDADSTDSEPGDEDHDMHDAETERKKKPGLGESKHTPMKTEKKGDIAERVEDDEIEEAREETREKVQAIGPEESWRLVLGLDRIMAVAGRREEKKKVSKAILDSIWSLGIQMDKESKGVQAWDLALQHAKNQGCPDHVLDIKKKWEGW